MGFFPLNHLGVRVKGWFLRLNSRSWRSALPLALMIGGLGLLTYVGNEYFSMYSEQKNLAAEWVRQESDRIRLGGERSQRLQLLRDGVIRLQIPKIDLDAYVLEGAGRKQLRLGVGRVTTSAIPGEKGNAVVTAHRDTFFRHIVELKKGDEIVVRRNGERLIFQMTSYRIVKPSDISVLKQTENPQLTLITCYPTYYIGPAPERLVVFSKLVKRGPDNELIANR